MEIIIGTQKVDLAVQRFLTGKINTGARRVGCFILMHVIRAVHALVSGLPEFSQDVIVWRVREVIDLLQREDIGSVLATTCSIVGGDVADEHTLTEPLHRRINTDRHGTIIRLGAQVIFLRDLKILFGIVLDPFLTRGKRCQDQSTGNNGNEFIFHMKFVCRVRV